MCVLIASLIYPLIRESEIFLPKKIPFRGDWRGGREVGVSQFRRDYGWNILVEMTRGNNTKTVETRVSIAREYY